MGVIVVDSAVNHLRGELGDFGNYVHAVKHAGSETARSTSRAAQTENCGPINTQYAYGP